MGWFDWLRRDPRRAAMIDRSWLERDAETLEALARLLARETPTLAAVQAALAASPWHDRDLGFGARVVTAIRHAGTLAVHVALVAHHERVAVRTTSVQWTGRPDEAQLAMLRAAVGDRMTKVSEIPRVDRCSERDAAAIAALDDERRAVLGPAPVVDVPRELAEPLATLCAPDGSLMVGDRFGYAATRTPGSLAIEALVTARRADLLGVALRGPNPGGRLLAAGALLVGAAGPATIDDLRVIALVRALPCPIDACSGCTVWSTTAASLLNPTS